MEQVNVICMKWGDMYGPHYVNRLYAMVKRNLKLDFRFVCLTDDADGLNNDIEILPIPEIYICPEHSNSPWKKLTLWSRSLGDLKGKTLFLDLDILIIDNIDCLFSFSEKVAIIENWTQKGKGIGNSSVFCFEIGQHPEVLDYFKKHPDIVYDKYTNEQVYLSKHIGDIEFWPEDWCRSFKFHSIPRGLGRFLSEPSIPKNCRILAFHGHPNPDQAIVGDYGSKLRKYFKPASWIKNYWHD